MSSPGTGPRPTCWRQVGGRQSSAAPWLEGCAQEAAATSAAQQGCSHSCQAADPAISALAQAPSLNGTVYAAPLPAHLQAAMTARCACGTCVTSQTAPLWPTSRTTGGCLSESSGGHLGHASVAAALGLPGLVTLTHHRWMATTAGLRPAHPAPPRPSPCPPPLQRPRDERGVVPLRVLHAGHHLGGQPAGGVGPGAGARPR